MPSFDVVSEAESHEVQNAFDQAEREIRQRYDFQNTNAALERTETGFRCAANSEERCLAIAEVLNDKFLKRKLSLKFLDPGEPTPAGGNMHNLVITLKKGIDKENAKNILQIIKAAKMKVTPSIQGEELRVTAKKRDDLQKVMSMLRGEDLPVVLTFNNFRD
ncbi:MAG: YajQ family cyclic di-GMP-binding protein [Deltaproteobacteria bacterium]|nr:YajQ family cyclic di-GMP-binding protein [Deltaproteobacteria bacterium]